MDIEQLATFLLVADTKSFSRTADALNIVQSTVTTRIQMLEKQTGKRLFIRDNRNLKLSAAGRSFMPYAERIVELSREGQKAIQLDQNLKDQLVIGSTHALWDYVLFPSINDFQKSNPQISLRLITEHSNIIIRKMIDGLIDLGIIFYPAHHSNIESIPLIEDTFDLVASPSFVAPDSPLTIEHFATIPFIHLNWGGSFSEWLGKWFGPHHIFPTEVDHVSLQLKFLINRRGVGFVPHSIAKSLIATNQLISIPFQTDPPIPRRLIYLIKAKRSNNKDIINKLTDSLRKQIK